MKIRNLGWILLTVIMALTVACGGGGSDPATIPTPMPPEGDDFIGGDGPEITPFGIQPGQFTIPGGFDDVRGVAASQEYVYVATATTLFAFDKNGSFVNAVPSPSGVTIQAVDVFPPMAQVDLPVEVDYFLAGFPVIAHNPIENYGYITIYGPNLDTFTTREDQGHPDADKYLTLPNGQVHPPVQIPPAWIDIIGIYDMQVDRFGSILVVADVDVVGTDVVPDYPRALQIFNMFNNFQIEYGGPRMADPIEFPVGDGVPGYHRAFGNATGDQGTLGIDTFFPFNRTELRYSWYGGHFNLLRDYVGVSFIELSPATMSYTTGAAVDNNFGFNRVIGESVGNAPGSFNQNPPVNPDGGLEDPDLTNGGPSGMGVDPLTDNIYICDPGNRRIQVFHPDTGDFLFQIGDGLRGRSGNNFLAPSEVTVDLEGNVFIADVTDVRVLRGSYPDRQFGGVGGTAYNGQLGSRMEGVSITMGNELGTLALRTTNIQGDYLLSNMLVGTYYLTASKFNFDSDTTSVQILSDRTVRADFRLYPNQPATVGSYSGSIIDDVTNAYVPDVRVVLVGRSIETTTDDIGRFQLNNILPGTYQVTFMKEGYETVTRDLEIFAGQTSRDPLIKMMPIF